VRAQRLAAATAAVGLVTVCCAASVSIGSISTSGEASSVKAVPDPSASTTTTAARRDVSRATGEKGAAVGARSTKTTRAATANLAKREVFTVSEQPSSLRLRTGTFNVRTARADDDRSWLERANDVAREIASRSPGVLALQELGPGRADGTKGTTTGHLRQTTSLERSLRSVVGDSRYQLVRTTPYVKPGTNHGTQGTRILYDTRKFKLLSNCPEKTGSSNYNPSCSMNMPIRSSDSESLRRSAAYAKFADRKTGTRFWVISVHLDDRHSSSLSTEKSYNALRGRQARAVYLKVNSLRKAGEEIIYAGDFNSWQTNRAGDAPHKYLVSQGFYDSVRAEDRINTKYPTVNHFDTTLAAKSIRLDYVMIKGSKRVLRYENVMKRVDSTRPSDHNLVVSDVVFS
jgi:endonuclease/exonuclease/phosphatase family metal-dependent hydrolase